MRSFQDSRIRRRSATSWRPFARGGGLTPRRFWIAMDNLDIAKALRQRILADTYPTQKRLYDLFGLDTYAPQR